MIYTIGGKKEYSDAIENGYGYKLGLDWPSALVEMIKMENLEEYNLEEVYPGGSVWETFEKAQLFLNKTPNDFTPPDVNPITHAVFGVDADWNRDAYQIDNASWKSLLITSKLIIL